MGGSAPPPQKPKADVAAGVNRPLAFTLKDIDHRHSYLVSRGFEEEECEFMGVGFFPGKGSMQGRIVFPIHNREGELVAYAGRSIEDAEPRWLFPAGFLKGQVLWNLYRVEEDDWTSVVVVESFWGVMACIRAGIMNSVALMSNHVTDEQARLLAGFAHVTLLMDGDRYGKEATPGILEKLKSAGVPRVSVVSINEGQPDDLTIDALRIALQLEEPEAVPIHLSEEVCA